jgi:hypothetical protein
VFSQNFREHLTTILVFGISGHFHKILKSFSLKFSRISQNCKRYFRFNPRHNNQNRTHRINGQNITGSTGPVEQVCQDKIFRAKLQDKTTRTGLSDLPGRTARTRPSGQYSQAKKLGEDSLDRTTQTYWDRRTGEPDQDSEERKAMVGPPGQDSQNRTEQLEHKNRKGQAELSRQNRTGRAVFCRNICTANFSTLPKVFQLLVSKFSRIQS